ncbi:MAG: 50S ribosomal protein L22 [Candidatus Peregrinibacteria bacterium]|nr:50S ribosomal protein L22 [Candidatus Peregrinibacteria bacterium]MCB9807741.1 50S ribosomal protein L22 [Candidatus Peribacteria bacterium]
MKATLRSVRIAPKKAQLVAKLIRGKSVPDAVSILEHTNKKAARLLEELLRSAMANASHNIKQDPQLMIVKELTVNKAQAYHRGVPMARGRVRPMRKFLSHIELSLGFEDEKKEAKEAKESKEKKAVKSSSSASKAAEKPVKKETTAGKKSSTTSTTGKSATKETTSKTSKSVASKNSPKKSSPKS